MSALSLLSLSFLLLSKVKGSTDYCLDEDACEGENINDEACDCYGYFGCEDSNITSTYSYDFGAYSNYGAINDDEYVWSYGLLSNYDSTIETYALYAYGYLSCYEAEITPKDSTLYAYFYGYYAGYYADILCYSGDTCKVYCGNSYGCADMSFYCYSGAYCYYDCSNDTNYCPTLYSGTGSYIEYDTGLDELEESNKLKIYDELTDDEITQYYINSINKELYKDNNNENKNNNEENIEKLIEKLSKQTANDNKNGYSKNLKFTKLEGLEKVSKDSDSLNKHFNKLNKKNKNNNKFFNKLYNKNTINKYKNYCYAMTIDGLIIFVLFLLYNKFIKNKFTKVDDVIFNNNEDSPLMNNNNRVVL